MKEPGLTQVTLGSQEAAPSITGMPSCSTDSPFLFPPPDPAEAWARLLQTPLQGGGGPRPRGPRPGGSLGGPLSGPGLGGFWERERGERASVNRQGFPVDSAPWPNARGGETAWKTNSTRKAGAYVPGHQVTLSFTPLGHGPRGGCEHFSLTVITFHSVAPTLLPTPFLQKFHLFKNTSIHFRKEVFWLTKH